MTITAHPTRRIERLAIGRERAPLLVIDDVVEDPEGLVEVAASKMFGSVASYYPGIRAKAPLTYQEFVISSLKELLLDYFALDNRTLRFTMCHFAVVTTPPDKLEHLQRIPHIDSVFGHELAFIHYLFKQDFGGTAFYRHRRTGFEYIDASRRDEYFRIVEEERLGADCPTGGYITGDTPLYEQVSSQRAVFNRMLVYRRNSLHSGSISADFKFDPDPRTGRLSVTGFLA